MVDIVEHHIYRNSMQVVINVTYLSLSIYVQCICNVMAHLHMYWESYGCISMFLLLCGSIAHYINLQMYTVLFLSVSLCNTWMRYINYDLSMCNVSAMLWLICICIGRVVAVYQYFYYYMVVLLTILICKCILFCFLLFRFAIPECDILIMTYLCVMYLQCYGSCAYVLGELWLYINIFTTMW
jgi:hypothetical protein